MLLKIYSEKLLQQNRKNREYSKILRNPVARRKNYGTYIFTYDSPMIRQFSAIDGLQKAYTLVYSMDADDESGCRLTLCRTGDRQCMESRYIAAAPEFGYRILRYLCENGVQPEIWQDVVEELADTDQLRQKGGALCGE